jgi:translation initiation factor IF-3
VRVNERIRAREIRVIDEEGKQLGIMAPFEALKMARSQGLDLVEVAPTANPPVCRIINYGKYLYQQNKRQHEARKHQKSIELKEVKFRPRTSGHDFEVKRNRIIGFLQEGDKVKATIMFRGRENAHRDLGMRMMERLIEEIGELALVEARPRQEGPNLTAILAPNKKVVVKSSAPKPRASGEPATAPATTAKPSPRPPTGAATAAAAPESPETSGG